jgi:hypothetical protein
MSERRTITPELLANWTVEWITLVHNPLNTLTEPSKNKFLADRINNYMNPPTTSAPPKPLSDQR